LRFLLGNIYGFDLGRRVKYSRLCEIDKWALSCLAHLLTGVTEDFERFQYYKAYRKLYNFCVNEMSSFYLDILKDRLYTFGRESLPRRSAQTVIYEILDSLTKVLAPILNFTAEEVWQSLSKQIGAERKTPFVILNRWPAIERRWINPALDGKMRRLGVIRNAVLKAIEDKREKGLIRSSLEVRVRLYAAKDELFKFLKENLNLLTSIFIVSDVAVERVSALSEETSQSPDTPHLGIKAERIDFPKCQRCWNWRVSVGKSSSHPLLCARCVEVIEGRN